MIIRGYTQHSLSSARFTPPVSGGRGIRSRFPEAKTAANVDMAFLTAAQNLVEMRRRNPKKPKKMDETGSMG